jgi:hypothetical protein
VKKGLRGYLNLKSVGTVQYVTTVNGGVMAVFGENEIELRAIKEFTQKGETTCLEAAGWYAGRRVDISRVEAYYEAHKSACFQLHCRSDRMGAANA